MHQIAKVTQTLKMSHMNHQRKERKLMFENQKETVGQRCRLLVDENNNVTVEDKVNERRNNVTDFKPTLSSSRKNGNAINPNQENNLLPCTPNKKANRANWYKDLRKGVIYDGETDEASDISPYKLTRRPRKRKSCVQLEIYPKKNKQKFGT